MKINKHIMFYILIWLSSIKTFAEDNLPQIPPPTPIEVTEETAKELANNSSEIVILFQKFGLAIGLVFLSVIIIVCGILVYKKFKMTRKSKFTSSYEYNSLKTPTNSEEAVKSFLNNTNIKDFRNF